LTGLVPVSFLVFLILLQGGCGNPFIRKFLEEEAPARTEETAAETEGPAGKAELAGLSLGNKALVLVPGLYNYTTEYHSPAPAPLSVAFTLKTGQELVISLNGTVLPIITEPVASVSGIPQWGTNTMEITVTSADGTIRRTYTITFDYGFRVHVAPWGDDGAAGTRNVPLATVAAAQAAIQAAYGPNWPGVYQTAGAFPAWIIIHGEINGEHAGTEGMIKFTDSAIYRDYPPVILEGIDNSGNNRINAAGKDNRVLYVHRTSVTLGKGLTLTGGVRNTGAGVYVAVDGKFTLTGGTVSGNHVTGDGGGVHVNYGSFLMTGGTITGNFAEGYGGGVTTTGGSIALAGGLISGNHANGGAGGGVRLTGGTDFSMTGGIIMDNDAHTNGGGVFVGGTAGTSLTMSGGVISGNTAVIRGGGVYVGSDGTFTKNGGVIYGLDAAEDLKNIAGTDGHAAYAVTGKIRTNTAGPGTSMDSAVSGPPGGWD
jgi:hypothetical protein